MKIISTLVALSDKHYPYADTKLVKKALGFIANTQPDYVVDLGDLFDNPTFSKFEQDPRTIYSFADTVEMVTDYLYELRDAAPNAQIDVKWGNHDERLPKFSNRNAPELVKNNLIKTYTDLLPFKELNIGSRGYNEPFILPGDLKITHGTKVVPLAGYSAHGELRKSDNVAGLSGHTHRLGFVTHRGRTWLECGHMCTNDTSKFLYLHDGFGDWQQGFAVGKLVEYYDKKTRHKKRQWILTPVQVIQGCFVIDGVVY